MNKKQVIRYLIVIAYLFAGGVQVSCSLSEVKDDIENLQQSVTDLQSAVDLLQSAQAEGKVVKEVTPIVKEGVSGWNITFTNGDSIFIMDGIDGIDGTDGKDGVSGENGTDGKDGVDGTDGSILRSIEKDDESGTIKMTMADGRVFLFNLNIAYPKGIVLLTNELLITKNSTVSFEFRVNPSDAVFNYDVEKGTSMIALDKVGNTRAVSAPTHYKLLKIEPSVNEQGKVKVGQYTAFVRDLGFIASYSDYVTLMFTVKNSDGKTIQLSSSAMKIERL